MKIILINWFMTARTLRSNKLYIINLLIFNFTSIPYHTQHFCHFSGNTNRMI